MTYLNLREAPLTFKSSLEDGHEELSHDTLKIVTLCQGFAGLHPGM